MKLNIKPLSVNEAWKGRRLRSSKYKGFINDVMLILKPCKIPPGFLELNLKFGFSNFNSDIDNPCKCFIDCLQKKYGFNDKLIYRLVVEREQVKKGKEFIEWNIKSFKN